MASLVLPVVSENAMPILDTERKNADVFRVILENGTDGVMRDGLLASQSWPV